MALGVELGNVCNVLTGKRHPSGAMVTKLESMLAGNRSS
jgi:hypothetical protein